MGAYLKSDSNFKTYALYLALLISIDQLYTFPCMLLSYRLQKYISPIVLKENILRSQNICDEDSQAHARIYELICLL